MAQSKQPHIGHRQRMRQRYLQNGLQGMAGHEILEMLLYYALPRVDTNRIAHRLMDEFGSFAGVLEASVEDLMRVEGVGEQAAILVSMFVGMQQAYRADLLRTRTVLEGTQSAKAYCCMLLSAARDEMFYVVSMDSRNKVLNTKKVSEGTIDALSFHPRQVLETIFRSRAKRVILCHNHPSGILRPSDLDIKATLDLERVLSELGIELLDHIIVGGGSAVSMAEERIVQFALF